MGMDGSDVKAGARTEIAFLVQACRMVGWGWLDGDGQMDGMNLCVSISARTELFSLHKN